MTSRRVLAVLAVAELLAMAPWFSASAVAPTLVSAWRLGSGGAAWLTISLQLGFATGAIVSALLTLSDIWSARKLVAASALVAGALTLGVAVAAGPATAITLRFLTGAALSGVYPPGMKIATGWFREARGFAIGIVVGALTVGSAAPHLIRAIVAANEWRTVLAAAAACAIVGGLLVLRIPHDGPFAAPAARFRWSAVPRILSDRGLLLANCGYLGHMWELYAMWTWIAVFVTQSELARAARSGPGTAALIAFVVIASGAVGSWIGGWWADRWGRTLLTATAMTISASCALVVGTVFAQPLVLLLPLLLVWGVTVVADSAQFSAAVSELAPREYVGTALTLQTCLGFLLTCITIYVLPSIAARWGWRWSMSVLAPGPILGVVAMLLLRGRPEALQLAGGRR